jgi:hypothetical protein
MTKKRIPVVEISTRNRHEYFVFSSRKLFVICRGYGSVMCVEIKAKVHLRQ